MKFDRESLAYAAGLFEGEGTVLASPYAYNRNRKTGVVKRTSGRTPVPSLRINMTDLEPLQRIHEILGGKLTGPYGPYAKSARKPYWAWQVQGHERAQAAAAAIWTWLGPRRREAIRKALLPHRKGAV